MSSLLAQYPHGIPVSPPCAAPHNMHPWMPQQQECGVMCVRKSHSTPYRPFLLCTPGQTHDSNREQHNTAREEGACIW